MNSNPPLKDFIMEIVNAMKVDSLINYLPCILMIIDLCFLTWT
jgi:hypothetical protein